MSVPCFLGSCGVSSAPRRRTKERAPPEGPWTCKPLTCITFSRTCARRTLLVSGIMKEGKDQNHAHLKKFLDSEFSLV